MKNPVVLLDEIDKLGTGWAGNPESALLEVLDPEQNKTFTDHYLELPFDLSEVMFVCTANTLETLSAPLRDRLEIVELTGYTQDEKVHIAKQHLVAKRTTEHGIADGKLTISDDALGAIVRDYTREAGVRQLDREIKKLCRAAALEVARKATKTDETDAASIAIEEADLVRHLGKPKFEREIAERTSIAGVSTGLAWTPFGGSILFIETSRMPGKGRVEITGQLGDVMKESARAALTYVRSNADRLGIRPEVVEDQDVHIHVPAGAVPKDGPSAGVTIFTALVSLFTGRRVRPDTAMTGEATLRGRVLPVGGIKAKVLAAHRAGIKRVILPAEMRSGPRRAAEGRPREPRGLPGRRHEPGHRARARDRPRATCRPSSARRDRRPHASGGLRRRPHRPDRVSDARLGRALYGPKACPKLKKKPTGSTGVGIPVSGNGPRLSGNARSARKTRRFTCGNSARTPKPTDCFAWSMSKPCAASPASKNATPPNAHFRISTDVVRNSML